MHSWDVCLPSQAFVLYPRSRRPSSKQKAPTKEERENAQLSAPPFEPCTCCTLSLPVFKSTRVEGAQATTNENLMKSWFVIQRALKCAVLAERASVEAEGQAFFYLSYQADAHQQAALLSAPFVLHNHLDTWNKLTSSNVCNNRASLQPALIASFIPIYFCHPDDLRDHTVESERTASGLRAAR